LQDKKIIFYSYDDICIVLLLSGYLACARCSSTGALVLIEPVSTIKGGDKPLLPPKTERCANCSGSGKVGHLEVFHCLLALRLL